ncbi:hypothetical protein SOCE836_066450 [Sorangium cellulosum]|uniref:Secreted protein n=2 Tax=Polyangiaceae TaxID=49 RepID=A0A4P2QWE8_SORCE|nr:hypothetical protein SOCE836_066450 [Sorangium cellulosum]WCQ93786.1 hypothetical protein NQZ70_06542 [Sorangium sp. Soce836]
MLARSLGLLTALLAAACARAPEPAPARGAAGAARPAYGARAADAGVSRVSGAPGAWGAFVAAGVAPRYVQGLADVFRVTHGGPDAAVVDRVVAAGARLELGGDGRVVAAAWEPDLWASGDPVVGSLAITPHLGGGFLHWTRRRAFRSRGFTGPLAEVPLGGGARAVRGARNGLGGVVIFTEQGPRVLPPGEDRGRALEAPAIHDLAALDAARAVRLDVFGRAATTADGGRTWVDAGRRIGLGARGLGAAPDALWLGTALGRVAVLPDGSLGRPDGDLRATLAAGAFQLLFAGGRAGEREALALEERAPLAPLEAAVSAGALLPDGTALGVFEGGVARIDARTGATRERLAGWLPDGLDCAPMRAEDGLLFLCAWDDYEGYGSYVLRSERGEAPLVERAFSDEGFFVADDGGAVGYVGGCAASPRLVSDEERDRRYGEVVVHPRICVRRGPGAWVERAIELGEAESLVGWAPRRDGSAVALLQGEGGALPAPVGARLWRDEGGARVVQLGARPPGWYWTPPPRDGARVLVDRRFRARDDGGVDGWLSSIEWPDPVGQASLGVTIAADGAISPRALPPEPAGMVVTGDHGVLVTRGGELHETLDHGRTWRAAGRSPVTPSSFQGACSALGCALVGGVRLGWGAGEPSPAVAAAPGSGCGGAEAGGAGAGACPDGGQPQGAAGLPVLSCAPVGLPAPLPGAASAAGSERWTVATPYGDTLEIVADAPEPERAAPPADDAPPPPLSEEAPPEGAAPGKGGAAPGKGGAAPGKGGATPGRGRPRAAALRTHSVVVRLPFDLRAEALRLDATALAPSGRRGAQRAAAVPLLAPGGEAALLVVAEAGELLLGPEGARAFPALEPRRSPVDGSAGRAPGLLLGPGRTLVLGEHRRRAAIEEHGPEPRQPARIVGLDREELRGRPMALARRDDGEAGVLVLDGPAPETAGAAALDRLAGTAGEVDALAPWSTLTAASDARCRAMRGAWRALVTLDPERALRLDRRALPAIALGDQGIAAVRWGRERVCLEALHLAVADSRRRGEAAADAALIARWTAPRGQGGGAGGGEGVLRTASTMQRLSCAAGARSGDE